MTRAPPAGALRRYAAYSLDFTAVGALAFLLALSGLRAAWLATTQAMSGLRQLLQAGMQDALLAGAQPAQLAASLLQRADIRAAADAVQAGSLRLLMAWLVPYALLAALYHVGFEASSWQGSPGKHALGLRVVDATADAPAGIGQLALRHAGGALSWLTLNLGHAWAALPPAKRALHDRLSGTRVLCDDPAARLPAWARCWIALQVVACVALAGWWLQRMVAALQVATG